MNSRKKFVPTILSVVIFALLTLTGHAAEKPVSGSPAIDFRFSAYYPPVYPVYRVGLQNWIADVEEESGGRINITEYLSGVLHSAKDGFQAVRSDIADITTGYPAYQAGSFHLAHAADLPFAFENAWVASLVMEELYPKYLKTEYEKMGVYLGFYLCTSNYNLISKKPVRTYEDLKGMKIRSFGGTCSTMLKKLGAVPVMVQSGEIYTSFQRGILDGVLFGDNGAASYRLYEIGKYSTAFSLTRMGIPYCMNKKTFDAMPPDVKQFFYNKLRQGAQIGSGAYELADNTALEEMKANGVERIVMAPEEIEKCRKAVAPLWDEFIEENEKLGLPARQFISELRALNEKYSNRTPEELYLQVTQNPVLGIIDFK